MGPYLALRTANRTRLELVATKTALFGSTASGAKGEGKGEGKVVALYISNRDAEEQFQQHHNFTQPLLSTILTVIRDRTVKAGHDFQVSIN